jgi:hypothetical protein
MSGGGEGEAEITQKEEEDFQLFKVQFTQVFILDNHSSW